MLVREVMNKGIDVITPESNLVDAAKKMRDGDYGVLPVCEGDKVIGMITDRDITIRATAESKDVTKTMVRDAMTPEALTCFEDDDIDQVTNMMSERQVRRIPVLNRQKKIVGIVALADLARNNADNAGQAVSEISEKRHDEPGARPH